LDRGRPGALNPQLRVLHFPPDYFSPERFVHWLRSVFSEYDSTGGSLRPARILFSSTNQLLHNSPMFSVEPLFVDALLELFKRKQVTSLFLDSAAESGQEISTAFDVIMFTARHGDDSVALRVVHSGPCNASAGARLITRELRSDGGWLRMEEMHAAGNN
jgi:hypothetical protein